MATVVLIDDNELIRTALRALLRHLGYEVLGEARDGESGLALVRRLRPAIVCLDVQLPGIDGVDVLGTLRAEFADLVVLIVSGCIDRDTMARLIEAGADGVVVKPVSEARLELALGKAVGARVRRIACQTTDRSVSGRGPRADAE